MSKTLRRTAASSSALLLALALVACGGDSGSSEGSSDEAEVRALTQEQADGALLSAEDVGEGYTELGDSEDEDQEVGCLTGLGDLSDVEATTEAENNFELESESSRRNVLTAVNSYDDVATIEDAFADFRASLEGCESVEVTDEESGTTLSLAVTVDEDPGLGETDEQIAITGTGSIAAPGTTYSYDLDFVVSRLGNDLAVVGLVDLAEKGEDVIDTLVETAVQKVADAR